MAGDATETRSGSNSCVFCAIRNGHDRINHLVVEETQAMAVLNLSMISPGHVLVLPTRHVEQLDRLTAEEVRSLWQLVVRVRKAIVTTLEPAGFVFIQNEGSNYLSETHLHVHVVPRYPDDGLRDMWDDERPASGERELRRIADLLAPALGR